MSTCVFYCWKQIPADRPDLADQAIGEQVDIIVFHGAPRALDELDSSQLATHRLNQSMMGLAALTSAKSARRARLFFGSLQLRGRIYPIRIVEAVDPLTQAGWNSVLDAAIDSGERHVCLTLPHLACRRHDNASNDRRLGKNRRGNYP